MLNDKCKKLKQKRGNHLKSKNAKNKQVTTETDKNNQWQLIKLSNTVANTNVRQMKNLYFKTDRTIKSVKQKSRVQESKQNKSKQTDNR